MRQSEWLTKTNVPFWLFLLLLPHVCRHRELYHSPPPAEFLTRRGFQLPVLPTRLWLLQASPAAQSPPEPQLLAQLPTGTLVTVFRYPYQGPEGCFCPSRAWKDTNCCQLLCGTILCKLIHFFFSLSLLFLFSELHKETEIWNECTRGHYSLSLIFLHSSLPQYVSYPSKPITTSNQSRSRNNGQMQDALV